MKTNRKINKTKGRRGIAAGEDDMRLNKEGGKERQAAKRGRHVWWKMEGEQQQQEEEEEWKDKKMRGEKKGQKGNERGDWMTKEWKTRGRK